MATALTHSALSTQDQQFAELLAAGTPLIDAAALCRYPSVAIARDATLNLGFQHLVRRKITAALQTDAAGAALKYLRAVAEGKEKPDRARIEACRILIDRAGHVAPKAAEPDGVKEKPLHELTREELLARVDQAEKERTRALRRLADDAAPVLDASQTGESSDAKLLSLLD